MNSHEELSAWMDGQAGEDRAETMVKSVLQDPERRARWNEWHLIGDVMRSAALARPTSLADRVSEALGSEPVHLPAPAAHHPKPVTPIRRRMPKAMAGGAVAAALAFVAFVALAPQMQDADGLLQLADSVGQQAPATQPAPATMNHPEVIRPVSSAPPLKYKPESLKGFKVVGVYERHGQSGVEMRRYVLSDGTTAVSVLVQPSASAARPVETALPTGAVSMLSRDIEGLRFVVSGDVPPDALRQFIQTIEWKNTQ
ncbi:MAG: hypothetical protein FGM18_02000 [Burkholderiaceae bacterium]|nr:hypothetical protein [Burkholderiaceae bacterium]